MSCVKRQTVPEPSCAAAQQMCY